MAYYIWLRIWLIVTRVSRVQDWNNFNYNIIYFNYNSDAFAVVV